MNVYTCTEFSGHWPVGTAAVIVAKTAVIARDRLEAKLAEMGLMQVVRLEWIVPLDLHEDGAHILCDGDY